MQVSAEMGILEADPGKMRRIFRGREHKDMSVVTLTKDNFTQEVLQSDRPVLVDFWASWCGPCQALGPMVDEVAEEQSQVKVGKVNVDEQAELAREYRIMSIPTLLVFRDGQLARREVGGRSKEELLELIR